MITFNIIPTIVSHSSKTRILNLWNPTASPLGRSIATHSLCEEDNGVVWNCYFEIICNLDQVVLATLVA